MNTLKDAIEKRKPQISNALKNAIENTASDLWNPIDRKTLVQWLEHVAGIGSPIEIKLINGGTHIIEASPHYFTDCETCKQIAGYLAQYHGAGEPS